MDIPGWIPLALFTALAGTGAYFDVRFRTIPNLLNALTAVVGLISVCLISGGSDALSALLHLALALAIGMLIYAFRMWGGGDAKFYAASAAWFPLAEFPRLISSISLCGLALFLGWFATRRLFIRKGKQGLSDQLPYGVAIGVGALLSFATETLDAVRF